MTPYANYLKANDNALFQKAIRYAQDGQDGRDWYKHAGDICKEVSWALGVPFQWFVAVLAATSPRVRVERNCKLTVQYCLTKSTKGMTKSVRTTIQNLEEIGDGAPIEVLAEALSHKTRPFALAICGQEDQLVLDAWMAHFLFEGMEGPAREKRQASFKTKSVQTYCIDFFEEVREVVGCSMSELQAAIWCATYSKNNAKNPPYLSFNF